MDGRCNHLTKEKMHPTAEDDARHFYTACISNNLNVVKYYLKLGFDVNSPASADFTEFAGLNPLHYAIKENNSDLLELFLKHNADFTIKDVNGQTPLQTMYYSGLCGSSMLKKVFIYGNNTTFVNSVDSYGVSNFHLCCSVNYPDLVKKFINKGVDVNSAISFNCIKYPGFTPLHFAVKYNCTEVVELLLKNGADCNKTDKKSRTVLHLACKKTNTTGRKMIKILLDHNASPTAADKKGRTPLHIIFHKVDDLRESVIDKFISKIPRKVNFTDDKGLSHFHIVCTRGDASRVSDFLESGVAVDSCVVSGVYSGYTALHFAALCNQKDVVEVLLQRNAQVNIKTSEFHFTPLHISCRFNMTYHGMEIKDHCIPGKVDWTSLYKIVLDIIKSLLRNGADVEAQDYLGRTPLIQTYTLDKIVYSHRDYCNDFDIFLKECSILQKEAIEILLSNNANINARTKYRESILHVIAKHDFQSRSDKDLIEFLIREGADVNAVDSTGFTPLHLAVQFVNTTLVDVLLKYNSNVDAKTEDSITPLKLSIDNIVVDSSKSAEDIFCSLLEHGVNVNVRTQNGQTILHNAVNKRMTSVVKKLLHYGADINMKDLSGDFFTSSLIKGIVNFDGSEYCEVFKIIFIHIQKLQALGLYVDKTIEKGCVEVFEYFERLKYRYKATKINRVEFIYRYEFRPIDFGMFDHFYNDCIEELERMKLVKIINCTSLYDVLKDVHELSKNVKNSRFVEIMNDQNRFPLYHFLLKVQFKKALLRGAEMELAKASLSFISGANLPDPCCDSVLKHLTYEDMVNLKNSCTMKESACKN